MGKGGEFGGRCVPLGFGADMVVVGGGCFWGEIEVFERKGSLRELALEKCVKVGGGW